ncbi:PHP domain-containing protein [Candidatus Saccharibacteria bacterium]|nr:PHP domain-containing protein [Candidatus Saccharibacteria bacterium]
MRIDLHTHSIGSLDGSITIDQYKKIIDSSKLDYIAITDHDRVDVAQQAQCRLGQAIIVGQEVTTVDGEIIGLFLTSRIPPGLSAKKTAHLIHEQGGLVYIPHPFETIRKGLTETTLNSIVSLIDIVEVNNGRAFFQNKSVEALNWANRHNIATSSSSDAHGIKGLATYFNEVTEVPTSDNLLKILNNGTRNASRPPLLSLFYPKYNRLRARLKLKDY